MIDFHLIIKEGFFVFRRSLLCVTNKPCSHCKEALFGNASIFHLFFSANTLDMKGRIVCFV